MLPVLLGALGLAIAAGVSSENRTRREDKEKMGAVAYWMGGRGPAAGGGATAWMGGRSPDHPYAWVEPSSLVANWSKGSMFGAGDMDPRLEMNVGPLGRALSVGAFLPYQLRVGRIEGIADRVNAGLPPEAAEEIARYMLLDSRFRDWGGAMSPELKSAIVRDAVRYALVPGVQFPMDDQVELRIKKALETSPSLLTEPLATAWHGLKTGASNSLTRAYEVMTVDAPSITQGLLISTGNANALKKAGINAIDPFVNRLAARYWLASMIMGPQVYDWIAASIEPSWSNGSMFGAGEMIIGPVGEYDRARALLMLNMIAAVARSNNIDLYPSNDPRVNVVHRPTGEPETVLQVWIREPFSQPSSVIEKKIAFIQAHLDRTAPGVYVVSTKPMGPGGYMVKIQPGSSTTGFGATDMDDLDEEFGFSILGFNIAITPGERVDNLDRKIENATSKKEKYEASAEDDGADLDYLAKKIARLEQMIDKWETRKEKIEMRMGSVYGGVFGDRWFKDPEGQAQAEMVVNWAKHVSKLPGVKRALKMRKKGYSDEQIQQGLDPYAMSQVHKGVQEMLGALQPMVTLGVNGRITQSEIGKFKLWMAQKYPGVELDLPTSGFGYVQRIMPNLTTAFAGERSDDTRKTQNAQSPTLEGAFWERKKGAEPAMVEVKNAQMDAVPLFGQLDFDGVAEDVDDIDLFGNDDMFLDDYDLG